MITDELRAYTFIITEEGSSILRRLTDIADRIDEEYKRVRAESIIDMTDERMAEHGWVRLPVDADDKVWNIGDFAVGEVNPNNPQVVERMLWYGLDSGWQIETNHIIFTCPEKAHHHKPPTVEDVLVAMLEQAVGYSDAHTSVALNTIAEYASKLQLKESE